MNIVISLGGSVICPDNVDIGYLKKFKKLILNKKFDKIVIYVGGGKLARNLISIGKRYGVKDSKSLDWLGIYATRINALFVLSIFEKHCYEKLIIDPTKKIKTNKKIIIAAGWKPGWSTDYDAVLMAKNINAKMLVNITNVNYIYDKDPKKFKNAKPIKKISWKNLQSLVGTKWKPGLNMPFDPIAAKEAEKNKLKVYVVGKDFNNLNNLLKGKKSKGTLICQKPPIIDG